MEELKNINLLLTKDLYNNIPVTYCKHCLSLKIMVLGDEDGYCDECCSTDIATTDINTWKQMYKEKYNKEF